jgi:hypothetical protein
VHRVIATICAGAAAAGLAGCDRDDRRLPASAPPGSFVKIVSVTPEASTTLKVGDRVKIEVEVSYALQADSGSVSLVVQAADYIGLAHNMEALRRGKGKTRLSAEFVVPQTNAIQVFTPLSAQGQAATSTVDHRVYKVAGK